MPQSKACTAAKSLPGRVHCPQWGRLELDVACGCLSGFNPLKRLQKSFCLREEGLEMLSHPLLGHAGLLSRPVLETSPQCCMEAGMYQFWPASAQTSLRFVPLHLGIPLQGMNIQSSTQTTAVTTVHQSVRSSTSKPSCQRDQWLFRVLVLEHKTTHHSRASV